MRTTDHGENIAYENDEPTAKVGPDWDAIDRGAGLFSVLQAYFPRISVHTILNADYPTKVTTVHNRI
jgi:hypothetical protein